MKIKFNGVLERVKSTGCPVCKGKRKSKYGFTSSKMYILPSGQTKTFRVGRVEEVSDKDGSFLLSYNGVDVNGHERKVFERVD